MSRFDGDDYEPTIGSDGKVKDTSGLWRSNVKRALAGKRGQAALRDLRDALLALPEKRLIEGALCTVGLTERIEAMPMTVIRDVEPLRRGPDGRPVRGPDGLVIREPVRPEPVKNWERESLVEFVGEHDDQPEGVCAIGAYLWWKKVKGGMDPAEAFAALPVLPDTEAGGWETADAGKDAGLAEVLAYELAYMNDERFAGMSPEDRYAAFLRFIDKHLAVPA